MRYRRGNHHSRKPRALPRVTQYLRAASFLPAPGCRRTAELNFHSALCTGIPVCMHAVQRCSADPVAAVRSWKRSQAQPCAGPRPSGQRRQATWDGPQTSRRRSLITPLALESPRAVLTLAWRSPRPSKRVEHTAQLTGPQGPPRSQQLQAEHGMARQADWLSGKSRQPSPGKAAKEH